MTRRVQIDGIYKPQPKSNFIIHVNEIPGLSFTYYAIKRHKAIKLAMGHIPECTFRVKEFTGLNEFKDNILSVGHLHHSVNVEKLLKKRYE